MPAESTAWPLPRPSQPRLMLEGFSYRGAQVQMDTLAGGDSTLARAPQRGRRESTGPLDGLNQDGLRGLLGTESADARNAAATALAHTQRLTAYLNVLHYLPPAQQAIVNKALEADIQLLGPELPAIAASRAESPRPQQRRRVDPTAVSESEKEGWEDDTDDITIPSSESEEEGIGTSTVIRLLLP